MDVSPLMTDTCHTHPGIFRPRPMRAAHLRLFCAPYAGRGASLYRAWPELLGPRVEVCSLQPPGREGRLRERLFIRIADVVQDAAAAIHPYLDIPFAFFGHSMGALICFELARHLRSQYNLGPVHMFISARRAPQFPDRRPPLRSLRDDQFVTEMQRRYNGIPREVLADAELMKLLLRVLRADVEMLETYIYVPGAPLECPITTLGGREDTETQIAELEGWREHTTGRFKTKLFPGNHFFVQSAQREVLETISHNLGLE